jgi:hypothetical protein
MLREEHEEEELHFTITRGIYICYTDFEPNRSIVRKRHREKTPFKNTRRLLLNLLSACHNLGDGMPDDHTSLFCLLLR